MTKTMEKAEAFLLQSLQIRLTYRLTYRNPRHLRISEKTGAKIYPHVKKH